MMTTTTTPETIITEVTRRQSVGPVETRLARALYELDGEAHLTTDADGRFFICTGLSGHNAVTGRGDTIEAALADAITGEITGLRRSS